MSETDNNNFVNIQNRSDTNLALGSKTEIQKEWSKIPHQKYIGEALHENLHGHGFYFVEDGEKLFYDGLFYANKLEGYAQVFYNDGSNFQGLYKNNVRCGPGVFTYPNGEQDVGLWSDQRLLRLASLDSSNLIPRLATTPSGQLKVLKYRYLVPVCPKPVDVAYDILQRLGASDDVLQRSHELYNLDVENKYGIFFNKKLFDEQFYDGQGSSIEVALNYEEEELLDNDSQIELQNPADSSDINVKRVKQINEGLKIAESKLRSVKEQRIGIQKRVELCRACCYQAQAQEESPIPPSEVYENDAEKHSIYSKPSIITESLFTPKLAHVRKPESISIAIEDIDTDKLFSEQDTASSLISIDSDIFDQSDTDVMSQIKNYLMDTCRCNEAMYVGDLCELEHELETVVRDELFFESIRNNLKVKLEKHQRQTEDRNKVKTKKISVNYVLSWNNEKYAIRMLKQSFLHRKSEYMVNFKVSDLIAGNRTAFGNPGQRERNCRDFLTACSHGDMDTIYKYIKKNDVDVNVSDAKGNNGVFYAAKNNNVNVIKVLVNLGAKLDQENDEGLLPLSMCLLMLLAKKHNVENWEKSFLPDVEPFKEREEPYKWYSNMSLLNTLTMSQGSLTPDFKVIKSKLKTDVKSAHKVTETRPYLFDTSMVVPPAAKEGKRGDTLAQRKMSFGPPVHTSSQSIENTIETLLESGANPNAGESPLPPLFLSIFTGDPNVVENVLEAHADVHTTIEDDMTCLHVITSSPCTRENVCICHLLISYDCDPRLKTSPNHWKQQKMRILGKQVNSNAVEDHGKNPLHILCMRRDFTMDHCSYFYDMVMNFRDSFIDFNDRYLGHTPLSLAVLVGNKRLVEAFMKHRLIDPHQVLNYNMGNVLTIYTLKRYEDIIPPNAQEILDYLVACGVNVLRPVGEFENSIEFMETEHEVSVKNRKKSVGSLKAKRKTNGVSQKSIMDYMRELGRETILKCIKLLTVENLYNLIESDFVGHNCVSTLAKYLTPPEVISNLELLFNHGKIKSERFDRSICLQLIDIVKAAYFERKKNALGSKTEIDQGVTSFVTDPTDYGFILNMADFSRIETEKAKFKLLPPGLDNIAKYKVCFHCLRKQDKDLIVCPKCQLVYFCSTSCNEENLQLNLHPCNTDFYQSELTRLQLRHAFSEPESLAELFRVIREECEKRRLDKLQKEVELQKKQFEEEMKSDTYGTKLLRYKQANSTFYKTPTLASLLGSLRMGTRIEIDDHDIIETVTNKTGYDSIKWDPSSKELIKKPCAHKKHLGLLGIKHQKTCKKKDLNCHCKECIEYRKQGKPKIECKCHSSSKKTRINFKTTREKEDVKVTLRKLRVIPQRCQGFINLLTTYFPDIDFSSLLLPYACYSNGHLYYKFLEGYNRTYSMM